MDVVVTVPKSFGLDTWIAEGDLPGEQWGGEEWAFYLGGSPPVMEKGERVYVVYGGKLRGFAPLVNIVPTGRNSYALIRHNGAEAVTIDEPIAGFRGFRYRWWDRSIERPFPDWKTP